jgi:site-specific DNA recombinase
MYIPQELLHYTFDIYKRRSSDDADHQVASLESQHEVLFKLVKENNLKIGRIAEESMSAKPGRPVFNEEIRRIEKREIQGLVIWDLSRASRNPVDSGTLSWLLQREILKAIITPQKIYLPEDNVLLLNVEFGMANQYLRDLSRNVKRGMQSKLNNGWRPGIVPEGYAHDFEAERGKKKILIDPVRFPLIRKAWDLLLTGNYTVLQILRIVNEDWGYRTNKHRSMGGNELARSSLYTIFTNTFYYGEFEYPVGSGKWYEGKHEPMITREEYDRAQAILGTRGKPRPKKREFAFTGMIRCGECGAMVTAEEKVKPSGLRYIYYHCTKRLNKKCGQRSLELKDFEEQVDYLLSRIEIPESFKDWAIKYLNELHDKESEDQVAISSSVDGSYKDCLAKINNLVKLKISPMNSDGSLLSDEDFEKQMKPLKDEKKNLEQKRGNLGERANKWLELSTKTFNFACYARIRFMNTTSLMEKKEILAAIGSNFILEDKILRLTVPKPFIAIRKAKEVTDEIIARFEPSEKPDFTAQLVYLYAQNSSLQGQRESNPQSRFWRPLVYR